MAFCSNCGTEILDLDKFCPSCGYKTPLKIQEIQNRNNKIKSAAATTEDIIMGIVSIPFFIVGFALITIAIIGAFANLDSFIFAMIGMAFGIILGAIPTKIGQWITSKIQNENVKGGSGAIGVIGGIIFGLTQVPLYLSYIQY